MLIGQILQERFAVKEDDLNRALELQKQVGGRVGEILVQTGTITEGQLVEALSEQLNLPLFEGSWVEEETLIAFLEEKGLDIRFLIKNNFLPLTIDPEKKIIQALTDDPLNQSMIDYLGKVLKFSVRLSLAPEQTIKDLAKHYLYEEGKDYISLSMVEDTEKLKEMALEAPVIKFLNGLLSRAVELRASDIHLESSEKRNRVRFRIDGILNDLDQLEESFYLALISRIKLLASLDIAEKRLPQDGKFSTKIAALLLDIRVSTIPTLTGEGVVMRLLYREKLTFDIQKLGLEKDHSGILINLIKNPFGIILVTGPTGSGKTTTLYSMLMRLNDKERKIITTEDPVEYQLEGINQIQVKSEIGLTFANALRSILRHDPDIIMVGEIRDLETAQIAIQSSLTGHLVLSTLHTNDAPSSLFRLVEMGIEDYLINASVIGVIAQRIIRKNCPYCSQPIQISKELLEEYEFVKVRDHFPTLVEKWQFLKGNGCSRCAETGYRGRIAIFELFKYTDELKEAFLKKRSLDNMRGVLQNGGGFRTLREDGLIKVANGQTTLEEVLRVS